MDEEEFRIYTAASHQVASSHVVHLYIQSMFIPVILQKEQTTSLKTLLNGKLSAL